MKVQTIGRDNHANGTRNESKRLQTYLFCCATGAGRANRRRAPRSRSPSRGCAAESWRSRKQSSPILAYHRAFGRHDDRALELRVCPPQTLLDSIEPIRALGLAGVRDNVAVRLAIVARMPSVGRRRRAERRLRVAAPKLRLVDRARATELRNECRKFDAHRRAQIVGDGENLGCGRAAGAHVEDANCFASFRRLPVDELMKMSVKLVPKRGVDRVAVARRAYMQSAVLRTVRSDEKKALLIASLYLSYCDKSW